jgi:hypothetical protein
MAADVVAAMRRGQILGLEFRRTRPRWFLSSGQSIDARVARLVIIHPGIIGDNDALFPGLTTSQIYRHATNGRARSAPLRILRLG